MADPSSNPAVPPASERVNDQFAAHYRLIALLFAIGALAVFAFFIRIDRLIPSTIIASELVFFSAITYFGWQPNGFNRRRYDARRRGETPERSNAGLAPAAAALIWLPLAAIVFFNAYDQTTRPQPSPAFITMYLVSGVAFVVLSLSRLLPNSSYRRAHAAQKLRQLPPPPTASEELS